QDNSTDSIFTVNQAGTYYVAVNLGGCVTTDTIVVGYYEELLSVFEQDTSLCFGEELTLSPNVQVSASYLWSDNSTGSTLIINDTSTYWVQVTTQCDILVDSIRVGLGNCPCDIEVPNVFTPNGDRINDYFYPDLKCELLSFKMSIYNRWGDLIFFTDRIASIEWDGYLENGKKASEGHYSYIIEYRDNLTRQNKTEKGSFMLMH
ncbi:MAG: gliding motility-associated C-terminal domain-containing protein, partial [Vicingaceae bacterium]